METTVVKYPEAPKKLSALIKLALEDLLKVEASPLYMVDMNEWHRPYGEQCIVCFAGGVMASRLGTDPRKRAFPADFPANWAMAMAALNYVRSGFVLAALVTMWFSADNEDDPTTEQEMLNGAKARKVLLDGGIPERIKVQDYDLSPLDFKARMAEIAQRLEDIGE